MSILVSGWRGIAHSYAIVNQFQCLELLRRDDVQLFFDDAPFLNPNWKKANGLFDADDEEAIGRIPVLPDGGEADVEFRISGPYDLGNSTRAGRTFVFGTAEVGFVPDFYMAGGRPLAEAHNAPVNSAVIITPSKWSADGFLRSGADADRIKVVPHGVETKIFRPPIAAERAEARHRYSIDENDLVFLHIGAMSANKNLSLLLRAFASVLKRHPNARLLLKGTDSVYRSKDLYMSHVMQALRDEEIRSAISRVTYIGETLGFRAMALLYHAADCYVAPYSAEGFNLPVLEASACGLPVICTLGGPTDEFTDESFALRIRSELVLKELDNGSIEKTLSPDPAHLEELMIAVAEDQSFRERASVAGPERVRKHYTWERAVDRLTEVMEL